MAAFGGFGAAPVFGGEFGAAAPLIPIIPITDDTAVAAKVDSTLAFYKYMYGGIDGTFDHFNKSVKLNAKLHIINTTLYRASVIDNDMQKHYRDAAIGIVSLSKKLRPMHNALSVVSYMRSDDPIYDTTMQNITSAITIPEMDEWIRIAINFRCTMQTNGAELILRRESYLASTKYRHEFSIDNVSALPLEVQLVICEFIGTDIAITASALLVVRDIKIHQFFDIITKPKVLKINTLVQTLAKQVDTLIKTQSMVKYIEHSVRNPPQTPADTPAFVPPDLILPMLDFSANTDTKYAITAKLEKVFETIILNLYSIDANARALMVLNMRKLAVVFKAVLARREKKTKRTYTPYQPWVNFSGFSHTYVEPPVCQALQNWLIANLLPKSSSENESVPL